MFRTLINVLEAVATMADTARMALEELEATWQEKKPQMEEAVIDLSLDIEEGLRATGEALRWTAGGAVKAGRTALSLAGRACRAVKAMAVLIFPVVRRFAYMGATGLYAGLRGIHDTVLPMGRRAGSYISSMWAFRDELLREARA